MRLGEILIERRQISQEGDSPLPQIGRVKLAGLTTRQAEEMLLAKARNYIPFNASVSITIIERYGQPPGQPATQPAR